MWNEHQLECMQALGIPVYEFVGEQAAGTLAAASEERLEKVSVPVASELGSLPLEVAVQPLADQVPEISVNDPNLGAEVPEKHVNDPIFYRLGPWCLQFPEVLPAPSWPWLKDLAHFIGGQPTQISHIPRDMPVINCADYAYEQLSPAQKRELWNVLKPALQ